MWLCQYAVLFVAIPTYIYALKEPLLIFLVSITIIFIVAFIIGVFEKALRFEDMIKKLLLH